MNHRKTGEITIKFETSYTQTVESWRVDLFQKGIELRQQLKEHKKKWSTNEYIDGIYFDRAIDAAVLILDNAQFNIKNIKDIKVDEKFPNATIDFTLKDEYFVKLKQKETEQESKASFTEVFPVLSKLIKNILDISESTESTEISEESKDQVLASMVALIDFAREKDLVDFNKFKPGKAEAEWQYTRLSKSLDVGT